MKRVKLGLYVNLPDDINYVQYRTELLAALWYTHWKMAGGRVDTEGKLVSNELPRIESIETEFKQQL